MISSAFAQGAGASFSLLSSPHIRNTRRGECITMLHKVLDSLTHRRVVAYRSVYLTCGFIERFSHGFQQEKAYSCRLFHYNLSMSSSECNHNKFNAKSTAVNK